MRSSFSIYEQIMELPLFKGTSRSQISGFIEKLPIQFLTFKNKERFISNGEECKGLLLMLKGRVELTHLYEMKTGEKARFYPILKEIREGGQIFGLDLLYGMYRDYNFEARALDECTALRLTKNQFMELMQSHHIYQVNVLNYLSYKSQKNRFLPCSFVPGSLRSLFAFYVASLTAKRSKVIFLNSDLSLWRRLTGKTTRKLLRELEAMKEEGIIRVEEENGLEVNREWLLESAFHRGV